MKSANENVVFETRWHEDLALWVITCPEDAEIHKTAENFEEASRFLREAVESEEGYQALKRQ